MKKFLVAVAFVLLATPFGAYALTEAQITSILDLLTTFEVEQSVLTQVESALRGEESTPAETPTEDEGASMCLSITRTLSLGSSGTDVLALQQFLKKEGDFTLTNTTTYFGSITEAAVKSWQERKGIVSSGSAATTGYGVVGPKTREAMNNACGESSFDEPVDQIEVPAPGSDQEEEMIVEDDGEEVVSGPPSCSLNATRKFPVIGDYTMFSWDTENATHVMFNPDTTNSVGVNDLPLPTGELSLDEESEVLASSIGGHWVNLKVYGDQGVNTCSLYVQVLKLNSFGRFEVYKDGNIIVGTSNVSRFTAREACDREVANYPDASITCTWYGDEL